MRKSRFSKEFKAVQLVSASDTPLSQLAETVGVCSKTLREWVKQAAVDGGVGAVGALTTVEKQELSALKKECRELRWKRVCPNSVRTTR